MNVAADPTRSARRPSGKLAGVLPIRPEVPADHAAIAEVVAAAFGSPAEAELVERIRASPNYHPEYALVAELDGRVVGHVMVSDVTLRDGDRGAHDPQPRTARRRARRRTAGASARRSCATSPPASTPTATR